MRNKKCKLSYAVDVIVQCCKGNHALVRRQYLVCTWGQLIGLGKVHIWVQTLKCLTAQRTRTCSVLASERCCLQLFQTKRSRTATLIIFNRALRRSLLCYVTFTRNVSRWAHSAEAHKTQWKGLQQIFRKKTMKLVKNIRSHHCTK